METTKPVIVSGYVRNKRDKRTPKVEALVPAVVTVAVVIALAFVYWQIGAILATIATIRISGVAVEHYRTYVSLQEPRLVVHRNA